MTVNDISFRDLYHQFFFLPLSEEDSNLWEIADQFPGKEDGNGLILYGYIDHTAGFTFEILAFGNLTQGHLSIFEGNDTISSKIRYGAVSEHEILALDESVRDVFLERTTIIDEDYKSSVEIEETRKIQLLDEFRSPEYPDDVAVIIVHGDAQPEQCWVRCKGLTEHCIIGTLLNEPYGDLGFHCNDEIVFGFIKTKDGKIHCVGPIK